jgi:signal transduction histidine kinase
MPIAVLPREVAARVITSGIARAAWAVSAANLVLAVPPLVEFMLMRDLGGALGMPLLILSVLIVMATVAAMVPKPWVVIVFLVLGGVGAVFYELALLDAYPAIADEGFFLLNRPAVSLVLVGAATTTWITGLAWTFTGYLVSLLVSLIVATQSSIGFRTGWGPTLMLILFVAAYLVLGAIQLSQRRRVPNFDQLEEETHRLALEENLRLRVTAMVHDTLLNDLSLVMNGPDDLDSRTVERLRADVATLTSPEWIRESLEVAVVDDQDAELRNQLALLISDLQWRGLTVHITGGGAGIYRLAPKVATALVDAIRACLENVLKHSGSSVAEIDLAYSPTDITVIVTDQGIGFDPAAIADDRLGLRLSVIDRVESVGGTVRVWSSEGAGTSIVLRVPVIAVLSEHEVSRHEEEGDHGE